MSTAGEEKLREWARETVGKQLGLQAKDVPEAYSGVKNIAEAGRDLIRQCAEIANTHAYPKEAILRYYGIPDREGR